jgi:hypothetical protein
MAYDKAFRESIGTCEYLVRGFNGLSRTQQFIELSISGGPTQPGIWLRLDNRMTKSEENYLKNLGETIVELNEDQVKKLRDLLNDALCTNAYGKGIAEMGGM